MQTIVVICLLRVQFVDLQQCRNLLEFDHHADGWRWRRIAGGPLHPHGAGDLAPEPLAGPRRGYQRCRYDHLITCQAHLATLLVCRITDLLKLLCEVLRLVGHGLKRIANCACCAPCLVT